jgi:hypothetical protein
VICGESSSPKIIHATVMCGKTCGAATSATPRYLPLPPRYLPEMVTDGLRYQATVGGLLGFLETQLGFPGEASPIVRARLRLVTAA